MPDLTPYIKRLEQAQVSEDWPQDLHDLARDLQQVALEEHPDAELPRWQLLTVRWATDRDPQAVREVGQVLVRAFTTPHTVRACMERAALLDSDRYGVTPAERKVMPFEEAEVECKQWAHMVQSKHEALGSPELSQRQQQWWRDVVVSEE